MTVPQRRPERLVRRIALWVLAAVAVVVVVQVVIAAVLGLVKTAVTLLVLGALAWVVIVGPPDLRRRRD